MIKKSHKEYETFTSAKYLIYIICYIINHINRSYTKKFIERLLLLLRLLLFSSDYHWRGRVHWAFIIQGIDGWLLLNWVWIRRKPVNILFGCTWSIILDWKNHGSIIFNWKLCWLNKCWLDWIIDWRWRFYFIGCIFSKEISKIDVICWLVVVWRLLWWEIVSVIKVILGILRGRRIDNILILILIWILDWRWIVDWSFVVGWLWLWLLWRIVVWRLLGWIRFFLSCKWFFWC